MRRRRVTREWNRSTVKRASSVRGVRRGSKWPRYAGIAAILLFVFLLGRGFGGDDAASDIVDIQEATLDIGGSSGFDSTVSDVLSGNVLSIPVDEAIVLDEEVVDEANIAQDTTDVTVADDAAEILLAPMNDFRGSATASSQFSDTGFQHVIVATLPDPPVGYYYEGWLIRSKPFDFFSTGRLIQHADDLKWYLVWEQSEDNRDYRKVVVTLEPDDGNPAPAEHVLEGVFN